MTKVTTVRVTDQTDDEIKRVQTEIGATTWAGALNYLLRRGINAHDAEIRRTLNRAMDDE